MDDKNVSAPAKRPLWRRILKITGISVLSVVALFLIVCTLIVWCLTPPRLTPIVESQASKFLMADVEIDRVELTFWHTFPKLTVDVDSLRITSHAFDSLPDSVRRTLPADADSLLSIGRFHGGVNLLPLMAGRIALYDVVFDRPRVNLVQLNDSVANYLIVPADTVKTEDDSSVPLVIPSVSINRFAITDASPLRFRSVPDSVDVALALSTIELKGAEAPRYSMAVSGNLHSPLLEGFNFQRLNFGADGSILWNLDEPMAVELNDFTVSVHDYSVKFSTAVDFSSGLRVDALKAATSDLPVAEILTHLPEKMRKVAAPLRSDMTVKAAMELTSQWNVADTVLPSFTASVEIPACSVRYENLNFNEFAVDLTAEINGADMNASVFTLKRLHIDGEVVDMDVDLKATDVMTDPHLVGNFSGAIDFNRLPPRLRSLIPGSVEGKLTGKSDFNLRTGDFTASRFHKVKLGGELQLKNFTADLDTLGRYYTRSTVVRFGSSNSFVANEHKVDSLLTISVKADTLSAIVNGMDLQLQNFRAGGGTANRRTSTDTTMINPFGFNIAFERLAFDSPADTLRCRVRNASVGASLTRYKGEAKLPRMSMKLSLGGLQFGQALTKLALRKAEVDLTLNKRIRPQRVMSDSMRMALAAARRDSAGVAAESGAPDLRLGTDERKLLRNWDFSGVIKADNGRMVTPAFPIRNRLENIDFKFNQDSIQLRNLRYTAGQSDFMINGAVTNLRRALTSRRNNTLGLRLMVMSDTINVNQIVNALFAGESVSAQADSAMVWSDDDRDEELITQVADTATSGPLLLPRNIDAIFVMRARNVLYSDLLLHSFQGNIFIEDGVLNLRNLSASAQVGTLRVDGLYSATSPDSLRFGMGMKVSDFRLDRLNSVIPAIDSILPAMKSFGGIVNADVAVTTDITPQMDIDLPSLRAAINIEGDSLVLLDPDTFKMLSKWLMFRDKKHNIINHMSVEVQVENSTLEVFPFMFDIDRYRLGVMGHNDLAMNMNYHVSVLKSPLPFKFGINVTGTPDNMKIRLGGAKVQGNMVGERQAIAADTRINLVEQINSMFRSGLAKARNGRLSFGAGQSVQQGLQPDASGRRRPKPVGGLPLSNALMPAEGNMSVADSLRMIRQGLIANPDTIRFPVKTQVIQ